MTGIKIVDASTVAALIFGEAEAEAIAGQLVDARLVAPVLLEFELANVCVTKMRRHPLQRNALRTAFGLARQLGIEIVAVDYTAVLDLADQTGLTAYDASYFWLARELGGELMTLDRKLKKTVGQTAKSR